MARTKTEIDFKKLNYLKKMTENKFGRTITTSKDCIDLTNALLKLNVNANLNAQTIRRLFGLVKNDFSPSIYTLDLLSLYVANTYWADYEIKDQTENNIPALANWIMNYYKNEEFGLTEVGDLIAGSEELQNMLLTRLAKLKSAHWMLFEHRPLRDNFNNNSYLKALDIYIKHKGTTEANIFGYGLFFKAALLTENKKDLEKYFHNIQNIELTKDVANIPAARKFGVPLIYYHLKNDETNFSKTFKAALTARNNYLTRMDYNATNFDSNLIEHLLLIGRSQECKIIWELHLESKMKYCSIPNPECYQQINLLIEAFAFGQERFYKKILKFDSNKMRIGERKFYTIFFLLYLIKFTKKTSVKKLNKLNIQLNELIEDTGYTYFKKLIS
ncbi:hypothetical protein PBAC_25450 [Pedobacter glucosidilyticus]|nr:hypothetical protein [Pedobacter glucosidilyticus]KHJ37215.1 hypothetical protein PBAC_25450 [Pedobacter glucosidilyticus]